MFVICLLWFTKTKMAAKYKIKNNSNNVSQSEIQWRKKEFWEDIIVFKKSYMKCCLQTSLNKSSSSEGNIYCFLPIFIFQNHASWCNRSVWWPCTKLFFLCLAYYTLHWIRIYVIHMVLMHLTFLMPTMSNPSIECLTRLPLPNKLNYWEFTEKKLL